VGPRRICDIYDFFAPRINVLTYLLLPTDKAYLSDIRVTNISKEFYLQDGGENQLALIRNEITPLSPCVYADDAKYANCGSSGNVNLWTSGYRIGPGETSFDWVFEYHSVCSTIAVIKYRMMYTNWHKSPMVNPKSDCVHVTPGNGYKWDVQPCNVEYCFVCENRRAQTKQSGTRSALSDCPAS